ncbi:prepilin-type N-terminal cleavage/methylation domain-containing protein [Caldisericum exile]|uniref:Prepilin-type N-terminal cleavage/methylation domain-containing protein n=1 Tax=Caldisericum exile (strain DSM 21853 / NBRC 104410 / AZM16c01) TaxID=511051 RepID=A0A7U6GFJ3_CALEA|nr:prepilin-type N-terminal cleavage/methylation domain-containing protein [Caldisericum exile]BAL81451.1 hypothetical protein CSE_13250 [Caldisericum exile AZM16c01]
MKGNIEKRGFTFIELSVVIVIVLILLGISIPYLNSFIVSRELEEVSWQLVQDLKLVRESAILYQQDLRVYFCTNPSSSRNFYMFETFLKDPLNGVHYNPNDIPDGIHFVRRDLKYNFKFTAHKPFKELGWINGKEYYYLQFYCGKDDHFRGQPNSFDTIEITNSTGTKTFYVIVDIVGRIRMSGSK